LVIEIQAVLESGNIQLPDYSRHQNLATSGHCRWMPAEQILAETGWNLAMVKIRLDLDGFGH
jgi:hypothetical protein